MRGGRGRRQGDKKKDVNDDDGFGAWGGYMAAKRAKLLEQFHGSVEKISDIFNGVEILVNGLTHPSANELKDLMAAHGGIYHMYPVSKVTHIIASNLPNTKIKHLGPIPIVKPSWITESIDFGKLLDYKRYLLYTNQSTTQPALNFPVVPKHELNLTTLPNSDTEQKSVIDNNHIEEKIDTLNQNISVLNNTTRSSALAHTSGGRVTKTASDPKFLEEFYNNSRLHLISTLGAEFKQLVGQLREKSDGKFPGREKLITLQGKQSEVSVSSSVIMHIDMDCFFVSVGLRNHPELKGKPVAITHARSAVLNTKDPNRKAVREKEFEMYTERLPEGAPSRVVDIKDKVDALASMSEIASCSYEARKCGIKNGMFLGTAITLCPDLKTLPYDFEGYKEVSHLLYQTIASYTLDIEAVSCDEMYVDITQILNDCGLNVHQWASHIRNEIMEATRCPCSTGFGANRLQARLATRKAKPAGQYYLQADDVEMYMSEIPLADLPGVGRATLVKLNHLGLATCGDVQVASLKILQSELGVKAGKTLWEQARGIDNKPLDFHHERKSVSAEINYGIRFKTIEECYNFLESLSNEVFNRLNDVGMRARCLTLKLLVRAPDAPVETAKFLGHGVCDALSKSTTSIIINDAKVIFREAKSLFDKCNVPFAELRGVGIQLSKLEKNAPVSKALSNFLKQGVVKKDILNKPDAFVENISKKESNVSKVIKETMLTIDKNETKKVPVVKTGKMSDLSNKSKRGRPKGSRKISITRPKSRQSEKIKTNTINNFFGSKSNSSRSTTPQQEIDLDVLQELPEEIRNEIIKDYQLENKVNFTQNQTQPNPKPTVENNNSVTPEKPAKRSPFDGLSLEQLRPIIKTWIQSESEPLEHDVELFTEHLKQLAVDRKIEILKSIFNFLHRTLSKLDCKWHKAYFAMVTGMQQGMVARYGRTLLIERTFHCCHI